MAPRVVDGEAGDVAIAAGVEDVEQPPVQRQADRELALGRHRVAEHQPARGDLQAGDLLAARVDGEQPTAVLAEQERALGAQCVHRTGGLASASSSSRGDPSRELRNTVSGARVDEDFIALGGIRHRIHDLDSPPRPLLAPDTRCPGRRADPVATGTSRGAASLQDGSAARARQRVQPATLAAHGPPRSRSGPPGMHGSGRASARLGGRLHRSETRVGHRRATTPHLASRGARRSPSNLFMDGVRLMKKARILNGLRCRIHSRIHSGNPGEPDPGQVMAHREGRSLRPRGCPRARA
jgi:hypothetical protein